MEFEIVEKEPIGSTLEKTPEKPWEIRIDESDFDKGTFTIWKKQSSIDFAKRETFKPNITTGQVDETPITKTEFDRRGFISGETWDKTTNLHARILKILPHVIYCECVLDKQNQVFEVRSFPKILFDHIDNLSEKHPVVINIKNKPGSTRIDIYNGEHIVDISLFDLKDGWDELKDSNLDKEFILTDD